MTRGARTGKTYTFLLPVLDVLVGLSPLRVRRIEPIGAILLQLVELFPKILIFRSDARCGPLRVDQFPLERRVPRFEIVVPPQCSCIYRSFRQRTTPLNK